MWMHEMRDSYEGQSVKTIRMNIVPAVLDAGAPHHFGCCNGVLLEFNYLKKHSTQTLILVTLMVIGPNFSIFWCGEFTCTSSSRW